ncbi:MAG: hypothetical protein ACTHMU_07290 [Thermomicrobiales bacterium]
MPRFDWRARRWLPCARQAAPFVVAALLLALGYGWHAAGVAHQANYQDYGFQNLNYSDIIWLYLRDSGAQHHRPYLDYPLEYPPLTGGLAYLLGFAPALRAYFALTYGVLAAGALLAIAALGRLPGAQRWYLAAAPALLLYTGLNWDLAAVALTALALVAYQRGHDRWGTLALVTAVWLKLFPIVFLAAILLERVRARRIRAAVEIGALFALGSAAINVPLALVNVRYWGRFFTANSGRRPEPSLWTLLPRLTTPQVNAASLALLAAGAVLIAALALRSRGAVTLPAGALLLLWWLFSNKVYSPQYALWVFLALALLRPTWVYWRAFVLFDLAYYYASFQVLYMNRFDNAVLTGWELRHLIAPLVVVRLVLLGGFVAWGAVCLARQGIPLAWPARQPRRWHSPAQTGAPPFAPVAPAHALTEPLPDAD